MSWLTASELSGLRDHFDDTLPDTCKIEYLTNTVNSIGAMDESWTARGTAIACRLYPLTGRSGAMFGLTGEQISESRYWNLALSYNQAIKVSDRVTVGGIVYQVVQHTGGASESMLKFALLMETQQ